MENALKRKDIKMGYKEQVEQKFPGAEIGITMKHLGGQQFYEGSLYVNNERIFFTMVLGRTENKEEFVCQEYLKRCEHDAKCTHSCPVHCADAKLIL